MELINLAVYVFTVLAVFVGALVWREHKDGQLKRYLLILEHLHESLVAWVNRADAEYAQILIDYQERAEETGKDPRLLWVIDQAEGYIKRQFKVEIDLEWLVNEIEKIVANR